MWNPVDGKICLQYIAFFFLKEALLSKNLTGSFCGN